MKNRKGVIMPDEIYSVSTPDVETEELIPGEKIFSWKNLIFGLLVGGSDYADEVNQAIDEAYAER